MNYKNKKGKNDYDKIAKKFESWLKKDEFFWLGDFAEEMGVNRQTVYDWAKTDEKVGKLYVLAKQKQENRLVHMGLKRTGNPAFAMFVLKNVAGWKDKQEIEDVAAQREIERLRTELKSIFKTEKVSVAVRREL